MPDKILIGNYPADIPIHLICSPTESGNLFNQFEFDWKIIWLKTLVTKFNIELTHAAGRDKSSL